MYIRKRIMLLSLSSTLIGASVLPAGMSAMEAPKASTVPISAGPMTKPGSEAAQAIQANMSRDEAVAIAKAKLEIGDDYTVSNVHLNSHFNPADPGSSASWSIGFTKRVDNRETAHIHVTVNDKTGAVIQFHRNEWEPTHTHSYPPKTNLAQAKEIARQYVSKLHPELVDQIRYNTNFEKSFRTPLHGQVRYHIRFDRLMNGIPFPQNGISADIDGDGNIVSYSFNWWEGISFEDPAGAMTASKAMDAFKKHSTLNLSYLIPYESKTSRTPQLAYQWWSKPLNAKTGEPYAFDGTVVLHQRLSKEPITPVPIGKLPARTKDLTREEAIQAVESLLLLPKGVKLEEASYSEHTSYYFEEVPSAQWSIRWSIPASGSEKSGSEASGKIIPVPSNQIFANVNAKTGEVVYYHINDGSFHPFPASTDAAASTEYKLSYEDAKAKAIELVKKAAPHRTHELYLEGDLSGTPLDKFQSMPSFQISFKRLIDGVETGFDHFIIHINRKDGSITSFKNSSTTIQFPAQKPQSISPEKALELWLGQFEAELQYTYHVDWKGMNVYSLPQEKYNLMVASGEIRPGQLTADAPGKAELIYSAIPKQMSWSYELYLDGVTGEWKNRRNGEKVVIGSGKPSDIDGHWAQKALELMAEYHAIEVKDGKAMPDQVATRGEMIKMLIIALNGGHFHYHYDMSRKATFSDVKADSHYFAYVETAADRNLIDRNAGTFQPDAPMNREELAELLVRALGYSKLAQIEGLFKLDLSDAVEIQKKGHAAIMIGLGIMTPSADGRFRPAEQVTRAQAATAFLRYLEKRAQLQDRPVY